MTTENNQISITAPGSSQQLPPEKPPPNRIETRMEDDQENPSITTGPPDEAMTDNNFTLSSAATPAQDEPDMLYRIHLEMLVNVLEEHLPYFIDLNFS